MNVNRQTPSQQQAGFNNQRPPAQPAARPAPPPPKKEPQPAAIALLFQSKGQIASALPKHLGVERMTRIAITELRKNPELQRCDPMSFLGAIMQCAQLGLEPGSGLGHAFLIPFKNSRKGIVECNFVAGYRGLIDLARRSGNIESIVARPVFERDEFEYAYGDDERIFHRPFAQWEGDDRKRVPTGPLMYVYAIARLKGGGVQREVMTIDEVLDIKERHGKGNKVWDDEFVEMARKTVVRRIAKYLPMSVELASVLEFEDTADGGSQDNHRAMANALDVEYEPVAPAHDPEKTAAIINEPAPHAPTPEMQCRQALTDFMRAAAAAEERGHYVVDILRGKTVEDVRAMKDPKQIMAATDMVEGFKR